MDDQWEKGKPIGGLYDVVVIGAGIMGSCTAYELAMRGQSVLLLEQFDLLHRRGSSHGESRIIRKTYPEEYYTCMMVRAYELWEAAHRDAGYSVITPTGGLDFGPPGNGDLQAVLAACERHGVAHEVLSAQQVAERFASLSLPEGHVGVYSRDAGVVHATKACAMFHHLASKHGCTLADKCTVLGIRAVGPEFVTEAETGAGEQNLQPEESRGEEAQESRSSSSSTTTLQGAATGAALMRVETSRGTVTAQHCVVAAGPWTAKLVRQAAGVSLPVQPLHTTVAYWRVRGDDHGSHGTKRLSAAAQFPIFINYDEPYIYGMPAHELPGLIKVSVHAGPPCDPDSRALSPRTAEVTCVLSPWLAARFGGAVDGSAPVMSEACMYSMTPDQDFILDSVPLRAPDGSVAKLHVAAGFSGHGFKMGPLIGKVMADLALTGASEDVRLELFSLDRFRRDPAGNKKPTGPQVRLHAQLSAL
eukprot:jgi/Mesen1/3642/ME000020S03170